MVSDEVSAKKANLHACARACCEVAKSSQEVAASTRVYKGLPPWLQKPWLEGRLHPRVRGHDLVSVEVSAKSQSSTRTRRPSDETTKGRNSGLACARAR